MRYLFIVLTFAFILSPTISQSNELCPAVVEQALQTVAHSCDELGLNEACYGNISISAMFFEDGENFTFNSPSDRVSILDLQSLNTSSLDLNAETWGIAVMQLQANLVGVLPGQAVTLLLMGDTTIENDVSPDEAQAIFVPLNGIVNTNANARSQPSTNANVVTSLASGNEVTVIGKNDAGDWYEIKQDKDSVWIWHELLNIEGDRETLPTTFGENLTPPSYGPMQSFYFQTGIGDLACQESPNALLVQNASGTPVELQINDLVMTLGSTVAIWNYEQDDQLYMMLALLEGTLETEVNGVPVLLEQNDLTRPTRFDLLSVSVNEDGRVDEDSTIVDLEGDVARLASIGACQNATEILGLESLECDVERLSTIFPRVTAYTLDDVPPPPSTCFVIANGTINTRRGPGVDYPSDSKLQSGEQRNVDMLAINPGGTWYRFDTVWVSGTVVTETGDCSSLPILEATDYPSNHMWFINIHEFCRVERSGPTYIRVGELLQPVFVVDEGPDVHGDALGQAVRGHTPTISIDSVPQPIVLIHVASEGSIPVNYTRSAEWIVPAGTHTLTASWNGYTGSCTFTAWDGSE